MDFMVSLLGRLTLYTHPTVDIEPRGAADALRASNAHRIKCPVLAALYRRGYLNPDAEGRCRWQELWGGLRCVGATQLNGIFQSVGIAAYGGPAA